MLLKLLLDVVSIMGNCILRFRRTSKVWLRKIELFTLVMVLDGLRYNMAYHCVVRIKDFALSLAAIDLIYFIQHFLILLVLNVLHDLLIYGALIMRMQLVLVLLNLISEVASIYLLLISVPLLQELGVANAIEPMDAPVSSVPAVVV